MSNNMLNFFNRFRDVFLFCLVFSVSFVFRSQIVRSVDPVTAAFVTYGSSTLLFVLINLNTLKSMGRLWGFKKALLMINVTTLVNNLLAFVIFKFISPVAYVMVFFSALSYFGVNDGRKDLPAAVRGFNAAVLVLAVIIGFLTAQADLQDALTGLTLSLISAKFGAVYIRYTSVLHDRAGASETQVLLLRFMMLIVLCAPFSFYHIALHGLSWSDFWFLMLVALTTCVIPLYLMQKSIRKVGSRLTSQFTALTPVLCIAFMILIDNGQFTWLQIALVVLVTAAMVVQTRLNFPPAPSSSAEAQ